MITREALMVLENQLTFAKRVNREFDEKFGVDGAKIGDSVRVRKPTRYVGRSGTALSVEDATEDYSTVTLNTQFGVDVNFTSKELTLSIDDFSKRILRPAISTIANKIDYDGLQLYKDLYWSAGTPGTATTFAQYLGAGTLLSDAAAPVDDRNMVVDPRSQAEIVDSLKGLFQSSSEIKRQYEKGQMGTTGGFDWYMDQNLAKHTVGPLGGTPLVNGASQTGASLVTDGWTAAAAARLNRGDVFTIASVYSVNPQNRQTTGALQQFVVTANVSSDGSGNATIPISPSIIVSGALQTVTGSPADNAALTVVGTASTAYSQGIAFHPDFATLATADLLVPKGVDMAGRMSDKQLGLSIRLVRQYDINNDKFPCRLDVLYGWKTLRPELAARVWR